LVRIRLQRVGKRNRPYYRVVVADARKPISGYVLDIVGNFDPIKKTVSLKLDRIQEWLARGAQMSPRVKSLVKLAKKAQGVPAATKTEPSKEEV